MDRSMNRKAFLFCCGSALLLGLFLRFYHLERRLPTADEGHLRNDMTNSQKWFLSGELRNHSVRHRKGNAPHGLLGPFLSLRLAWPVYTHARRFLPENSLARENLLSRWGYAWISIGLVLVLFALAWRLFGLETGLMLGSIAALSPLLINWGRAEYLDPLLALWMWMSFGAVLMAAEKKVGRAAALWFLLAGVSAGCMVGTKWTGLIVLPFLALAYLWLRGRAPLSLRECLNIAAGIAAFLESTFFWLSWESFRWVLFPKSTDPLNEYGDMKDGLAHYFSVGLREMPSWDNFRAVALIWAGPLFLAAVFLALSRFRRPVREWTIVQKFMGIVLLCAFVVTCTQGGSYASWRMAFPASAAILLIGFEVERFSERQRRLAWGLMVLLMIPFSVYEGLRLGKTTGPYYYGQDHRFDDKLEGSGIGLFQ